MLGGVQIWKGFYVHQTVNIISYIASFCSLATFRLAVRWKV